MASLVPCSERFEYFSSFIKYIFRHILASFCCFSLQIFRLYCLWVITNPRLILLRVLKNPFSTNFFFLQKWKFNPVLSDYYTVLTMTVNTAPKQQEKANHFYLFWGLKVKLSAQLYIVAREDKGDREGITHTHPIPYVIRLELFLRP